jgi:flagellar hook-associated protein 2
MPSLRISGLSSGIDTESAIKELMKAQRIPVDKLKKKRMSFEWTRDAYREVNTKLTDFRNNKVFNYRLDQTLSPMGVSLQGNKEALTATVAPGATPTNMIVDVTNLAVAASKWSTSSIHAGAFSSTAKLNTQGAALGGVLGTYTFSVNGTAISVNTAQDSLNDVLTRINRTTNVSAFFDSTTGKVSFAAKNSGLTNGAGGADAHISFADTSGNFLSDVLNINTGSNTTSGGGQDSVAGANANLTINGMVTTRTSNTFTINGTTINLLKASAGQTTTVMVDEDVDKTVQVIKDFIKDYNDALSFVQGKSKEPKFRDYLPLTDEEKSALKETEVEQYEKKARSGLLRGDSILKEFETKMRAATSNPVSHSGTVYKTLTSIGIETGLYTDFGKLTLKDESKLRAALAAKPEEVKAIFNNTGNGDSNTNDVGIANRLYTDVKNVIDKLTRKAGTASVVDNSVLGKQILALNKDILKKTDQLTEIENRYYKQFSQMEGAMNNFNAQSSYLGNLISGLQPK